MNVFPFGERGLLVELDQAPAPERIARTLAVAARLRAALPRAEIIVGGGTVLAQGLGTWDELESLVAREARAALDEPLVSDASSQAPSRTHELDVVYDGIDLGPLADTLHLSTRALIDLHTGPAYSVEFLGFLPGFAYLGPVAPPLDVARRTLPRPRVPAGSVAIAGGHTGIYPLASPGGWSLLGRAIDASLFDATRSPACRFAPGDQVRFRSVRDAPAAMVEPAAPRSVASSPALVVVAACPGATIQDAGRFGALGDGVPPSGPCDPTTHAAANLAVGNSPSAAAIEIPLGGLTVRASARARILVSIDGEDARALRDGETIEAAPCTRAMRYLAVAGGVDVPLVLGARATLLAAAFGGLSGRPIRPGDALPIGPTPAGSPVRARPAAYDPPSPARLIVVPGPHLRRFPEGALDALLEGEFVVSRHGDRVGTRLDGAKVPREGSALPLPCPMLRGAVQVASNGTPIVLGPDHPTTGGYPVIAVVRSAGQALLARLRPGHAVRFVLA